jgi:D-serine deaminase-like pyridoxal phosphate-dependent protein
MDHTYQKLAPEFEQALSVLTRVISRPRSGVAVLDTGVKGVGHEFGAPKIKDHPEIEIPFFLAEEHCVVPNAPDWSIGDTVHLIPSHACTTSNLHRYFHVHEEGKLVDVWPIEASGRPS